MQLLPRRSPKATSPSRALVERDDPVLPAVLEFQSPSTAITTAPIPRSARGTIWVVASMFAVSLLALGVIRVDQVVTAQGRVISITPTMVVQPLEISVVRSIEVREGEIVRAGQVLARLDPTFATADLGSLTAQVSTLQAQVSRMQAEVESRPFTYSGLDPDMSLQAAIFGQRQAEYELKLEGYKQKIDGLVTAISRSNADADGYRNRLAVAQNVESMRRELDRLGVGSKLNTLAAMDNRAEMQRYLTNAMETAQSGQRDLSALIAERNGYIQSWHADLAEKLSDAIGKLSDAREQLNKAQLRRQLVELRADRDATVQSVARVSEGSVLQPGQQFITLVPADAPLEVEANIPGREDGYVRVGDPVTVKFDTFPYTRYGVAYGTVRIISPDSFIPQDDQRNPTGAVPTAPGSTDPYYRAHISLDRVALHDTPANFRLVPGMSVTADVAVGKRTVLSYMLQRVMGVAMEGMREP
jgi:HlyD family secretion protein